MDKDSRTSKSLKNGGIAILFYCINLLLQFYARKIFLDHLGTEIIGLNTTAMNLLQFLNLAELGISGGASFILYKPLKDNDINKINSIVTLLGQLYRRVGIFIIIGGIVLMVFFPIIFEKISLPLWYTYASFNVLLFSSLLGYFVNYKQIILSASQQDYKILISYKSIILLKICFQAYFVYSFTNGYDWWLILEVLFSIIASVTLGIATKRSFPALKNVEIPYKRLRKYYPEFTLKIKQLFFHKIGSFALTQSSPLIIYAFTSLSLVALYGNYMIVISGVQMLFVSLFNNINAGIGNLVAEGNKEKQISVFFELFSVRFFLITTVCFCAYLLIPDFITFWIGQKYLLPNSTLFLMLSVLYISTIRYSVDSYIMAFGLFRDIWAPIAEAVTNISLSIFFGYIWGLNGILLGVLCSLIIFVGLWKPYFLFTNEFSGKLREYFQIYFKHICAFVFSALIAGICWKFLKFEPATKIGGIIINALISSLLFSSILFGLLIVFRCGIVKFVHRFIK